MPHLMLNEADRHLLRLRHESRWPLRRIANHLGVNPSTISRRLKKLIQRHNLTQPHRPAPKRKNIRPISLSDVFEV
jgi:IS30 family transposase